MSLYIPEGEVSDLYVNVNGTAKQVTSMYANANGTAKLVYELIKREYPSVSGADVMLYKALNRSSFSEDTQSVDFELQTGDKYEISLYVTFSPTITSSVFDEVDYYTSDIYLNTSLGTASDLLAKSYAYPSTDSAAVPSVSYTASGTVSSDTAGNKLSYTFTMSSGSYAGSLNGEGKTGTPVVSGIEFYITINGNEIFSLST